MLSLPNLTSQLSLSISLSHSFQNLFFVYQLSIRRSVSYLLYRSDGHPLYTLASTYTLSLKAASESKHSAEQVDRFLKLRDPSNQRSQ